MLDFLDRESTSFCDGEEDAVCLRADSSRRRARQKTLGAVLKHRAASSMALSHLTPDRCRCWHRNERKESRMTQPYLRAND